MVINMSERCTVDGTVKTYEVPLEMSEVIWKRKKYPIVSKQPTTTYGSPQLHIIPVTIKFRSEHRVRIHILTLLGYQLHFIGIVF